MAQGTTYRYISDGGHGWAEVPIKAVLAAGIRPSRYSYYDPDNGMAYLEEDCDLGRYLDAANLPDLAFADVHVPGDCWVRDLPRWTPEQSLYETVSKTSELWIGAKVIGYSGSSRSMSLQIVLTDGTHMTIDGPIKPDPNFIATDLRI